MRRFVLLMCAGAAALLLASGAVWAIEPPWPEPTKEGDRGGGLCVGGDRWEGGDRDGAPHGGPGGEDIGSTGGGADRLYGGPGDDHLYLYGQDDGAQDRLHCGEGHDTYYPPDASDHVAAS